MPRFLVYIPSPMPGMPNLQIKVSADNWMMALQIGRQKVGEKADLGSNILCDFKEDGSVEVTDPNTGRAFSIREIEEAETASIPQTPPQQAVRPEPQVAPPAPQQSQTTPQSETIKVQPQAAVATQVVMPSAPSQATPPPKVEAPSRPQEQVKVAPQEVAKKVEETKVVPKASPAQASAGPAPEIKVEPKKPQIQYQPVEKAGKKVDASIEKVEEVKEERRVGRRDTNLSSNIESIMAQLFTEVYDVYNVASSREDVANFMLDLAMKKIGVEAGSVLYADLSETELSFIAVRGPRSEELKKFKVPIGKGIVGFCVDLGVSLAISDVSKDKRWFDKISKSIGFPTKSILCAPIQYEGQTIGAIELINKKGESSFSVDDLNILNYIAHETAEAFIRIEGKKEQKK